MVRTGPRRGRGRREALGGHEGHGPAPGRASRAAGGALGVEQRLGDGRGEGDGLGPRGAHLVGGRRRAPLQQGPLQQGREHVGGDVRAQGPVFGILGEHLHDEIHQRPVEELAPQARRRRLLLHVGDDVLAGRLAAEYGPAGDHLVEDAAHGVDVGAGRHLPRPGLLGGHVAGRADGDARAGEVQGWSAAAHALGDAEVQHLDEVRLIVDVHDHDVLGLHVAVDDALGVSLAQGAQDLPGDPHGARRIQRSLTGQEIIEGLALQVLHDQEQGPVVGLPEVDEANGVRVLEGGDGAGLFLEPRDLGEVVQEALVEDLERHGAPHGELLGPIHGPHPPPPQHAVDAVAPHEGRAEQGVLVGLGPHGLRLEAVVRAHARLGLAAALGTDAHGRAPERWRGVPWGPQARTSE